MCVELNDEVAWDLFSGNYNWLRTSYYGKVRSRGRLISRDVGIKAFRSLILSRLYRAGGTKDSRAACQVQKQSFMKDGLLDVDGSRFHRSWVDQGWALETELFCFTAKSTLGGRSDFCRRRSRLRRVENIRPIYRV